MCANNRHELVLTIGFQNSCRNKAWEIDNFHHLDSRWMDEGQGRFFQLSQSTGLPCFAKWGAFERQ